MTLASTDDKLSQALTRLLAGQPRCTNGELTVTNLCLEAGVGRDSYYRSTIKDRFAECRANAHAQQPEAARLRDELRELTAARKADRREHARAQAALEELVRTYANQIQVLTLLGDELARENERLRHLLVETPGSVTALRPAGSPALCPGRPPLQEPS
ncbi:hypothetical protein ACFC1R_36655 [Kitasatospora sp. NPDC056138]|uniref:hypothetical protein n=1 Tax=Kitasatospora sp. NPDC056138 TaxID=3345724 RepID=UPI0035D59FA5